MALPDASQYAEGAIMAKKPKRRPIRRQPQDRTEEINAQRRWLDNMARTMIEGRSTAQLRSDLHDRELLLLEADRAAQMDPSPVNLAQFRAARSQVEAARRAVELSATSVAPD
jgi:hypothetical protein